MSDILLENVSVNFPIYDGASRSLKYRLVDTSTGGRIKPGGRGRAVVNAIDSLSIHIAHGERVALIGHNGAGKTTLLRVIAGIYIPQVGRVHLNGSVAPLFDTGFGMDPDATGYENISLRGLYLGMTKKEIKARLPDIEAFADLGSFLSMPLRTYSAGMQARLAFAVSTSIEPEILLLDEQIGAGDAAFMERATHRLEELVERSGILVLASHSADAVSRFCTRGIVMEHGRLIFDGPADDALAAYEKHRETATDEGV